MRKAIAHTVVGAFYGLVAMVAGAGIRGDDRLQQPGRDLFTGVLFMAGGWLLGWSFGELEAPRDDA